MTCCVCYYSTVFFFVVVFFGPSVIWSSQTEVLKAVFLVTSGGSLALHTPSVNTGGPGGTHWFLLTTLIEIGEIVYLLLKFENLFSSLFV